MAKPKNTYKCTACGNIVMRWAGQCPHCSEWNTIEEYIEPIGTPAKVAAEKAKNRTVNTLKLKDVSVKDDPRIITGITEFDRVVGCGLVVDSLTIITGAPGSGKSSVLSTISDKMLSLGKTVVYASGEESASQIKARADRLKLKNIGEMYISDERFTNNIDKYGKGTAEFVHIAIKNYCKK